MAFRDFLTAEGERLLAKSIVDSLPITFTRLIMGSGYLAQGINEKNVTEIVTEVKTLDIKAVSLNDSTSAIISAYFNNEDLKEGFFFREKGIYMQVGTEEVLAIYGNAGSTAEYIDTSEICVIEKLIRTTLQLTSDEIANVTIWDGTCAVAPIIIDKMLLSEFVNTDTALTVTAGQMVILSGIVHHFIGGDQRDINNYSAGTNLSDVYDKEIPGANKSGGIAASQNAVYYAYSELSDDIKNVSNSSDAAYKLAQSAVTIAKGRNQSLSYLTYLEMVESLNAMGNTELRSGQNIYIGTRGVPDLWVYSVTDEKVEYNYESDDAIVDIIGTGITLQVGYYNLSFLETQKVDLTEIKEALAVRPESRTVTKIELVQSLPEDAASNLTTLYLVVE